MAGRPHQVLTRLTTEQQNRLDEVQAMEPALPSSSAAVRRLIDSLEDSHITLPATTDDAAEGKEFSLGKKEAQEILKALHDRTRAYSELSKEIRAIGNNANQLTKLGHQLSRGRGNGIIPQEAVESLERKLDEMHGRLSVLANQDHYVEMVVNACRS